MALASQTLGRPGLLQLSSQRQSFFLERGDLAAFVATCQSTHNFHHVFMYSVFQGARVSTSTVQCDLLPIFLRVDVVRVYLGMRTRTRARCKSADGDNSEKERGREREKERMERERERERKLGCAFPM